MSQVHLQASEDVNKLMCNMMLKKKPGLENNGTFPKAAAVDPFHRTDSV